MRHVNCILLSVFFLLIPITVLAGNLDDPGAPTSADSAMYTLENIYNRLNSNTQATKRSGAFTEPSAAPGSTGHTLDQIYEKAIPTQVPKTGQTICYDANGTVISCTGTGQDGGELKGVAWPDTRFTDNLNGTVTDNLTGLVWLKKTNCVGAKTWDNAILWCNALASGTCDLTDSSSALDWRLPNLRELLSLVDFGNSNPALPDVYGDYFESVQSSYYWSSTTSANVPANAWAVYLITGSPGSIAKGGSTPPQYYIWPVRGGQ